MGIHRRKPNRLKGYDYSENGTYFITFCTQKRYELLWKTGYQIPQYELSEYGEITEKMILKIPVCYPAVVVDQYVIMPNHVHLLLSIQKQGRAMRAPTIATILNQMKGAITKQIGFSIWQKLFHDHIVRNQAEYQRIWEYIDTNPLKWEEDCFYSCRGAHCASSEERN